MSDKQLNVKVPANLKDLVESEARRQNIHIGDLVIQYIENGLNSGEKSSLNRSSNSTESTRQDPQSSRFLSQGFSEISIFYDQLMNLEQLLIMVVKKLYLSTENEGLSMPQPLNTTSSNSSLNLSLQEQLDAMDTRLSAISARLDQISQVGCLLHSECLGFATPPVVEPIDNINPSTDSPTISSSEDWLTQREAFDFAKSQGFSGSLREFQLLYRSKDYASKYARWGLVADLSRRSGQGKAPKWLRIAPLGTIVASQSESGEFQ